MKAKEIRTIHPEYFTISQLSSFSGLGSRFLRDALKDSEHPLPHFRIGHRTILVSRTEFAEWLEHYRARDNAADLERIVNLAVAGVAK